MPARDNGDTPFIARDATYHRAPEGLEARVRGAVARVAGEERAPRRWQAFAFAASLASVAVLSWSLALHLAAPAPESLMDRDLVTAHVRSLMPGHAPDVLSSDRHTVKPWFAGKVDFAPPVYDLAAEGFPLRGGRLDYVDGRAAAVLVYGYRLHTIDVFVWPAGEGADEAPHGVERRGYSIVAWRHAGLAYHAVSDAEAPALIALAGALGRPQPPQ
jgi:anti-sigma factor RsiW